MPHWDYKAIVYSVKAAGFLKENRVWMDAAGREYGPCERSVGDFAQAMRQLAAALQTLDEEGWELVSSAMGRPRAYAILRRTRASSQ